MKILTEFYISEVGGRICNCNRMMCENLTGFLCEVCRYVSGVRGKFGSEVGFWDIVPKSEFR